MDRRAFGLGAMATLSLSACASASPRFLTYNGPEVTSLVINKGARKMYLLHNEQILKEYKVDLGFAPAGTKNRKGDGRTPGGTDLTDRRNPRSRYHLSLGISYPNSQDIAKAKAAGVDPGGDIFIHGQPNRRNERKRAKKTVDWTAGCIAVKNEEMEEIYSIVNEGTMINLRR